MAPDRGRIDSRYRGGTVAAAPHREATVSDIRSAEGQHFLLRFPSLFHEGRSLCFPCDARGEVRLNDLSSRARNNYLFARAAIGRDFAWPVVEPLLH
jgi:hypothetical protein